MSENKGLIVSPAPHIAAPTDTTKIMADVIIALIPALAWGIYMQGIRALFLTIICVAASVISEALTRKILKRPQTVGDLSAAVTGIIMAMNLPVGMPYWQAIIGCVVSIVVVKQLFGGLGQNFANPAIVGRIVLFVSFATPITTCSINSKMDPAILAAAPLDAVSGPTPLALLEKGAELPTNMSMFLGKVNGCMGELSTLLLLVGGLYLIVRKVITWHIPVAFIGTAALMAWVFGMDPVYQLCAGGLMIGAIFMATDYVTSPITPWGKIIFGVGCGLFTMLIRKFGAYPEGVSFAILLMNILSPRIDDWTRHKINGVDKNGNPLAKGGAH